MTDEQAFIQEIDRQTGTTSEQREAEFKDMLSRFIVDIMTAREKCLENILWMVLKRKPLPEDALGITIVSWGTTVYGMDTKMEEIILWNDARIGVMITKADSVWFVPDNPEM